MMWVCEIKKILISSHTYTYFVIKVFNFIKNFLLYSFNDIQETIDLSTILQFSFPSSTLYMRKKVKY